VYHKKFYIIGPVLEQIFSKKAVLFCHRHCSFYSYFTQPSLDCGLYYKHVTVIIYYCSHCSLYYKLVKIVAIALARIINYNLRGMIYNRKCTLQFAAYLYTGIFLTPVLIRYLWQHKTVVFLHWYLICVVPLMVEIIILNNYTSTLVYLDLIPCLVI